MFVGDLILRTSNFKISEERFLFPDKDATLKAEEEEWALPSKDRLIPAGRNKQQRGKELFGGEGGEFLLSVKCCTDNKILKFDSCIETVSLLEQKFS